MATTTTWREPLGALAGNAVWLGQPIGWYWTGFVRHPTPLAPALAYENVVVAPAVLVAAAAAGIIAVLRGRVREVLGVYLPSLAVLALVPPTSGVFRVHAVFPLACAGLGLALVRLGVLRGAALLALGALAGLLPLLPERPAADGRVDLARMLLANPQHNEGAQLVAPDEPVRIGLRAGEPPLVRRLWLRPGRWRLDLSTDGWLGVDIDGKPVIVPGSQPRPVRTAYVDLDGWLHTIAISSPISAGRLFAVTLWRAPDPVDSPPADMYVHRVVSRSRHTQGLPAGTGPVIGVGWRHRRSRPGGGSLGSCHWRMR
jgi:hypothetical protein